MKRKTIAWVFSGIGVATIVALLQLYKEDNVTSKQEASSNVQQAQNISAGRNVTIIQSQNSEVDKLDEPLSTEQEFIGALDRTYANKKNGYFTAEANYRDDEITFIAGNCLFVSKTKQNGGSWDLFLSETDGICSFLNEIESGAKIMRIIPAPGRMANSGRVLEFVAQSGTFALDDFFGTYLGE